MEFLACERRLEQGIKEFLNRLSGSECRVKYRQFAYLGSASYPRNPLTFATNRMLCPDVGQVATESAT